MEANTKTISVLLVDGQTLFRSGIRSLLQRNADFAMVGETADGVECIKRARSLRPDIVLLDLDMPGMPDMETLHLILQDCLSEETQDQTAALQAGARGYLIKNIDADGLVYAICRAASGEPVLAEAMGARLVAQMRGGTSKPAPAPETDRLTPREREILACLTRGESNKVIARTLDVAESTVKIHVQNILKKLKLASRVQAAVYAVEHGMAGAGIGRR